VADGANPRRRSIYLQILRLAPVTLLQAHDQPIMAVNCTRRGQSTVATQALTLLNSDSVAAAARDLADRARAAAAAAARNSASAGDASAAGNSAAAGNLAADSTIRYLGLAAWSRDFAADEVAELKQFVARQTAAYAAAGTAPANATAPANGTAPAAGSAGAAAEQERQAWYDLAHMLLAANEFVYID
jgi:hypothetical protein